MKSLNKIPSGIEGFDSISMGGIPKERMSLIMGTPGSGKTIFCVQYLLGGIESANEPGVFVTFEESPDEIKLNMKGFGWDIQNYIDKGLLKFVDISPRFNDNETIMGEYDLSGLILRIKSVVEQIGAKRIAIDSVATLFNTYPNHNLIRREIIKLKSCLKSLTVTSLLTSERYDETGVNSHFDVLDFVSDNVIVLKNQMFEEYRRRTIEILKYRGAPHKKGQHSFTIKGGKGITIISFERNPYLPDIERKRTTTGIEKIDEITSGGFFQGSSILISGQTGSGKTLLTLALLNGALKHGERCILFNFEESNQQIYHKAKIWNIDLEKAEKDGQFRFFSIYPESLGIEDLITDMRSEIQIFSPDRIFIDSISALERITTPLTFRESLINLFLFAREENIISVFTTTTPSFSGPIIGSEKHISTLSDMVILLRYFENKGELIRALAIMKMRDSDHSKHFWKYMIDNNGIHFLGKLEGNVGLFSSMNNKRDL
jgi:circadian clock protein KaiC